MDIIITEIISDHFSIDKEVCWLKCRTGSGSLIAFWGELGQPNRNIAAIRNQELPLHIEILDPEECVATQNEKSKYGISLSIPSGAMIQIHPD